jgi:D-glycero-beta-D-manno-heptose 1-phosphate adenylyltransferase
MNWKSKIYKAGDHKYNEIIDSWKQNSVTVVFTNGCFDLLHIGHIHYINEASELGDKLVIGLNSDNSVKKLKGESRPVNNELSRSAILAFMKVTDLIIIFDTETPYDLIKEIMPDVLVKGGDWKPEEIIGSDIVLRNDGVVKSLSYVEGYSSSKIIDKIQKNK